MRTLFFVFLFPLVLVAEAQLATTFYQGAIVDRNQAVIVSQVALQPTFDAVLYKVGKTSSTTSIMPAHQVASFRYYDSASNINRHFVSLKQQGLFRFYEIVLYGKVQIIRRLKKYAPQENADEGFDYNFFVFHAGNIYPLSKFKSKVLPSLAAMYGEELTDFVEDKKLNLSKVEAIFQVIKKCNQLSPPQGAVVMR